MYLQPGEAVEFAIPDDGAYWIVVPVGPSGVGFRPQRKFYQCRIALHAFYTVLSRTVVFSAGENRLRFYGFSLAQPKVRAQQPL